MSKKRGVLIAAGLLALVLVVSVITIVRTQQTEPRQSTRQPGLDQPRATRQDAAVKPATKDHRIVSKEEMKEIFSDKKAFMSISVRSLKKKFGTDIHAVTSQLNLMTFRAFMQKHYPEDWAPMFTSIIKEAFPDEADAIFRAMATMDAYNIWFETAKHELARMDYHEMKLSLWEKRREMFGEDAGDIWKEEAHAEQVKDALAILDDSVDTSIDEKLMTFNEAAAEGYLGDEEFLQSKKYSMATAFLNLSSVQQELAAMKSYDRQNTLKSIRQQLGYTDKEIEQMESVDDRHEKSWATGLAYMEDRNAAIKTLSGEALTEQIADLRQSYFGHKAQTIAKEEADGFFRYNRPRVYGRN